MSAWLADAWNTVQSETIANSLQRCFLGETLSLHIAMDERYGLQFRIQAALAVTTQADSEELSNE
jgi:hypothetical protein